jgi:hypothetical protein
MICLDLSGLARGRLSLAPLGRPGLLGRCCKQHMSGSGNRLRRCFFGWLAACSNTPKTIVGYSSYMQMQILEMCGIPTGIIVRLCDKKACGCLSPGFSIPDVSDGLRTYAILRSKQYAVADIMAECIWSRGGLICQEPQSVNFSGLASCENISLIAFSCKALPSPCKDIDQAHSFKILWCNIALLPAQ